MTYPWNVKEVEATVAEEVEARVLSDLEPIFEADLTHITTPRCTTDQYLTVNVWSRTG